MARRALRAPSGHPRRVPDLKGADPDFEPARPVVAANVRPQTHRCRRATDHRPRTTRAMDLLNVVYEVLLQLLSRYFAHTDETPEQLEVLADVSVGLMYAVIKPLGQRGDDAARRAGNSRGHGGPGLRAVLPGRLPAAAPGGGMGADGGTPAGCGGVRPSVAGWRARPALMEPLAKVARSLERTPTSSGLRPEVEASLVPASRTLCASEAGCYDRCDGLLLARRLSVRSPIRCSPRRRTTARLPWNGPARMTRALIDGLAAGGVEGHTVLDIGGGVGAVHHELLRSGAASAVDVGRVTCRAPVAHEEAERQGDGDRVEYLTGDFIALAVEFGSSRLTLLPALFDTGHPPLREHGGARRSLGELARHRYGLVYPRDTWLARSAPCSSTHGSVCSGHHFVRTSIAPRRSRASSPRTAW